MGYYSDVMVAIHFTDSEYAKKFCDTCFTYHPILRDVLDDPYSENMFCDENVLFIKVFDAKFYEDEVWVQEFNQLLENSKLAAGFLMLEFARIGEDTSDNEYWFEYANNIECIPYRPRLRLCIRREIEVL